MFKSSFASISYFLSCLFFLLSGMASTQEFPYQVHLSEVAVSENIKLQSFALGEWNNQIFLFGGRKDGLHQRQPFASFAANGMNASGVSITLPSLNSSPFSLSTLPVAIQEQLSSTNMQFVQQDQYLFVVGGYGYSSSVADHVTYSQLTIVDLELLSNNLEMNIPIENAFYSISDDRFAVTGGALKLIDDTFYLMGGHRFDGRYNPMNGSSFTQTYHEKIIRFNAVNNKGTWSISFNSSEWSDSNFLHRRDLNCISGFNSNGEKTVVMFSGVFQPLADLPWLNSIEVSASGYNEIANFSQLLSQYHCGNISLYSTSLNKQHYVFLGGIAEYYFNDQLQLTQNTDVPFTKSISCVTRTAANEWIEEVNLNSMPGFLGSGAEVVLHANLPRFNHGVVDIDNMVWSNDSASLGYFIGGIESSAQNIFWINDGSQSQPNNKIYEVWLIKSSTSNTNEVAIMDENVFRIYPNPSNGKFKIEFTTDRACEARLMALNMDGKCVATDKLGKFEPGKYAVENNWKLFQSPGMYLLQLKLNDRTFEQRLLIEP